jgi:DNA primase
VVFCFDGDRAGRQAAWRALENALPLARDGRELKFMFLPDGHDPDTLVAEEGANAFESRLSTSLPLSEYLIQHLMVEVDLTHIDGRAKLKALAAPLFARMPEGIYREMLAESLASRVGMPAAALKKSFAASDPKHTPAQRPEPSERSYARMSAGRGNLLTQAITLVLHHPAAAGCIGNPDLLNDIQTPGVTVLKELLEQATASASPSTAILLEHWRDRAEYGRLSELAMVDPLVADAAGAAHELQMAVEKLLQEFGPGRRMDELLRKAEETGLNYDEKAELSLLLKSKGRSRTAT